LAEFVIIYHTNIMAEFAFGSTLKFTSASHIFSVQCIIAGVHKMVACFPVHFGTDGMITLAPSIIHMEVLAC
jgi:hypothetical protein